MCVHVYVSEQWPWRGAYHFLPSASRGLACNVSHQLKFFLGELGGSLKISSRQHYEFSG